MAGIEMKPLSNKALLSIKRTGYLNVWEGAVRSAKTVASSIAWILYVTNSPESTFIMSGKTQSSLYRNVIGGDFGIIALFGKKNVEYKSTSEGSHVLLVKCRDGKVKKCYCFGADNVASADKVRGLTAGGWYADEINLHHKEFVEECFRRTIVSKDRKHFWTLNPDTPFHWIYTDFIDKYQDAKLPGFNLWHFTLNDNKAISEERKAELKLQYSGVFYKRYILGERCLAEDIIYDGFDEHLHIIDTKMNTNMWTQFYVSVDYGTHNPCTFGLYGVKGNRVHLIKSYYYDGRKEKKQKSDTEYAEDMVAWLGDMKSRVKEIIIDPSASSFITELRKKKYGLPDVIKAKNDVNNGIRTVQSWLKQGLLTIEKGVNKPYEEEFGLYSWDIKASEKGLDQPLKEHDHCMDALRYMIYTKFGRDTGGGYDIVSGGDNSIYQLNGQIGNPILQARNRGRGVL